MVTHARLSAGEPQAPSIDLAVVLRVLGASPAPTLVVAPSGRVTAASHAAEASLGARSGLVGRPVRDLLGVGWRELELVAAEGKADLVVDPPGRLPGAGRRGWRVRPERLLDAAGAVVAVVAYLDEPAPGNASDGGRRPPSGFDAIFGDDPRVRATKEAAARFAETRLPILLLAETGTGKDLLARAVHAASPRRDRPLVAINCGALSPHLLESELFGYAPGAFTDARREGQEGKIGAARGGTLFLDEVAEMPGPLQALLLRVLEDGVYYRVGDNAPRQADVRLICATCRDLPRMVAEGAFRQDLFYRVAGVCLSVPPVRERSDVAALVEHVFDGLVEREWPAGRSRPILGAAAVDWMVRQSWPGNIRQLKTALQYALILADGSQIEPRHLPPQLDLAMAPPPTLRSAAASPAAAGRDPTLGEVTGQQVRRAVAAAGGNLTQAARQLGIARSTLYRHLRRSVAGVNEASPATR